MTRAALHSSLVMHKIQYTTRASHSLCIGFYALLVIRAMQLSSFINRVGFFNTSSQKILEYHIALALTLSLTMTIHPVRFVKTIVCISLNLNHYNHGLFLFHQMTLSDIKFNCLQFNLFHQH